MSTVKTDTGSGAQAHHYAHHFENAEHEYSTSKQGVWLFLATEVLMFGGLFVAYAIFHHLYPEVFKIGARATDWRFGSANTVVLLTSSLTMALGIYNIQMRKNDRAFLMLAITVLCGFMFMGIKYMEYSHKIHEGFLPGSWYHASVEGAAESLGVPVSEIPANLPLYFSFYFMMTGLHGIHVLIGMSLIVWTMIRLKRGDFSPDHYTAVEGVGLFWHLVDLVWIYLFPLLYLVS